MGTAVVLRREPARRLPPSGFHPHATQLAAGYAGAAFTVLQPGCRTLMRGAASAFAAPNRIVSCFIFSCGGELL